MLNGCHRKEKARRLSCNQAFSPNSCIDMPWRSAGCSKWRIITDLRCPLGSMLSAILSKRPTTGETDPITDVSHRACSCSARTWIHTHANELYSSEKLWFMSSWLQGRKGGRKQHGRYISELFKFLPPPAEWREERRKEASGSCKSRLCECKFTCIHLVRTCTKSRFEKPGEMQSMSLHFLWRSIPQPQNTHAHCDEFH